MVGSSQGASVTTKDHLASVTGATTAYAVNIIGRRWGTWQYNSVRFSTGGATLRRRSGHLAAGVRHP